MNPEKGVKNDKFYYLNHKLLFKNKAEECELSKALSSTTLNLHIFTLKKKEPGNLITILMNSFESNFNE